MVFSDISTFFYFIFEKKKWLKCKPHAAFEKLPKILICKKNEPIAPNANKINTCSLFICCKCQLSFRKLQLSLTKNNIHN